MEFTWGWNTFQKFLNKPMQMETDFGGRLYIFFNSISPLRVNWCVPKTWVLPVLSKWT